MFYRYLNWKMFHRYSNWKMFWWEFVPAKQKNKNQKKFFPETYPPVGFYLRKNLNTIETFLGLAHAERLDHPQHTPQLAGPRMGVAALIRNKYKLHKKSLANLCNLPIDKHPEIWYNSIIKWRRSIPCLSSTKSCASSLRSLLSLALASWCASSASLIEGGFLLP